MVEISGSGRIRIPYSGEDPWGTPTSVYLVE